MAERQREIEKKQKETQKRLQGGETKQKRKKKD